MRAGVTRALAAGWQALEHGSAVDAVEAAIRVLEDNPNFNASYGSAGRTTAPTWPAPTVRAP